MSFTLVHRTPLDVVHHRARGFFAIPFSEGIFASTAPVAELVSPAIEAPKPFDRLVGSWNAKLSASGALVLQAQVLPASGPQTWSSWFELGREDKGLFLSPSRQNNACGFVDEDTLRLKTPAKAFRYRVIVRQKARARSVLTLVAMSVSGPIAPPETAFAPGPWVREIKVAPRSQMTEQSKHRRDICSPTALAMALSHWGRVLATARVAKHVQDQTSRAYGNWTFNMAFAGSRRLMSYFSYLNSLEELQQEIAAGRPVVVSITFDQGELSGSPIKKTRGHLVLTVGLTRRGDIIALDPAAPSAKTARRIYRRREFRQAWLVNKRGAAYLISPLEDRAMAVGAPFADLMASPRAASGRHDLKRLSQILYGESVIVRAVSGNWANVEAAEQPRFTHSRWSGYPGWIAAQNLSGTSRTSVNRVVAAKSAQASLNGKKIFFSLGTRLDVIRQTPSGACARLLGLETATMPPQALAHFKRLSPKQARIRILKTAGLFMGLRYVWGGRSGVQKQASWGVDCSGLASLAYRAAGLEIPRDAADQKRLAKATAPKNLKPGDLIFLSSSDGSPRITHVMIYAGGDLFLESRRRAGGQSGTFSVRFGAPLMELKAGHTVLDYTLAPPRPRRICFGSYL